MHDRQNGSDSRQGGCQASSPWSKGQAYAGAARFMSRFRLPTAFGGLNICRVPALLLNLDRCCLVHSEWKAVPLSSNHLQRQQ